MQETITDARILIVDDEAANVRVLERLLARAGYAGVKSTTDSRHAVPLVQGFRPDLVLLDLMMPYKDGFEIMAELRELLPRDAYLPILVLTADTAPESKRRALAGGAKDFLNKPLDVTETLLRIENLIESRFLHRALRSQNESLEEKVHERTLELRLAQLETIERLARAAEYRDDETGRHAQRVGVRSGIMAEMLGLPDELVRKIRRAAPLHDVGKIGIPDRILLKPGRLTDEEFEIIKTHTMIGARILSGSASPILRLAEEIARTHHEWWNGEGYEGFAGEDIPLAGRVVAVVDVLDALTHDRPYRRAWPLADALDEIERLRGTHFDPELVDVLLAAAEQGRLDQAGDEEDPEEPVHAAADSPA